MRGSGRVGALLAAVVVFAAACDLGGGSSNPTADISPQSSPSSSTSNPVTASPPTTVPSPESSPSTAGLAITSLPVHNGEVGVIYLAVSFQATGGTAPYTWSAANGTLPPGLALSAGGIFTGNNTTAGSFSFQVKVTDSGGQTATGNVAMKVFPPLAVSQPCISACFVGFGCTTCGRFGSVSGGAGPYHYKLVGGAVPTGMTLNGLALSGAWQFPPVITVPVDVIAIGPPRALWNLSVSVTDDFGVTKTVSANWIEFGPIFTNCSVGVACATCTVSPCSTSVTYSGGNPSGSVTVSVVKVCDAANQVCVTDPALIPAALPPGWSAVPNNGTVSITMDCTNSTACPNGTFLANVYMVVVDHGACVAPQYVDSQLTQISISV